MAEIDSVEHDVLIIGAGGAGLRAAIEASRDEIRRILMGYDVNPERGKRLVAGDRHPQDGQVELPSRRKRQSRGLDHQHVRPGPHFPWKRTPALDRLHGQLKPGSTPDARWSTSFRHR